MQTPHRILVIDDDALILRAIRILLQGHGYEIDTASDGAAALRFLAEKSYALVIVDRQLGGGESTEVIASIRRQLPTQFLLMFSGECSGDAEAFALAAGADGFLQKGCGNETLLAEVAKWCGRARGR